jgi:hypothetical protein
MTANLVQLALDAGWDRHKVSRTRPTDLQRIFESSSSPSSSHQAIIPERIVEVLPTPANRKSQPSMSVLVEQPQPVAVERDVNNLETTLCTLLTELEIVLTRCQLKSNSLQDPEELCLDAQETSNLRESVAQDKKRIHALRGELRCYQQRILELIQGRQALVGDDMSESCMYMRTRIQALQQLDQKIREQVSQDM